MSDSARNSRRLKELALEAGFEEVGIATAEDLDGSPEGERLRHWLAEGRAADMAYMARDPQRRLDPRAILPGAVSVLSVALSYWSGDPDPGVAARGRVARYAWGRDYHKTFTKRLKRLEDAIAAAFPGTASRGYVDTGPVLEKLWAERAGLGWRGKHTNLVSRRAGSWLLLGEILLDLDLEPDAGETDHCGSCSRCLEVCPTSAFPAPYELDARRCISYLTIEYRGSIPRELRPLMGNHVFGCDDCLEVCPWNRFARAAREADFKPRPEVVAPLLTELVTMNDEEFLERFAGTALTRPKREGLARNACIALGNTAPPGAVPALAQALHDPSALVREHAAWALGLIAGPDALAVLAACLDSEPAGEVRIEIERALNPRPLR